MYSENYISTNNNKDEYSIYHSLELINKMNEILATSITSAPVPKGTPLNPEKDFTAISNNRNPEEIIQFIALKISRIKSKVLSDNNIRFNNTELLSKTAVIASVIALGKS